MIEPEKVTGISPRLLLVGYFEEFHVGAHFRRAAEVLGWPFTTCDASEAHARSRWLRALFWRAAGRRPVHLRRFGRSVVEACRRERPTHLVATGRVPPALPELAAIGQLGVVRINFLTDDPWNRVHRAAWMFSALNGYDAVFTPRRSNLGDLAAHTGRPVHYLPFAYAPDLHHPAAGGSDLAGPDVLFVGGADAERLPVIRALVAGGLTVALYGGYWDRHADLRPFWRGYASLAELRDLTATAKTVLCLVRQANRDGHAMRSFEVSAMGGCALVEDTAEHREIFGADGEAASYFRDLGELVARARALVADPARRTRLREAGFTRIRDGRNTYADRLEQMVRLTALPSAARLPLLPVRN